ncbi:MAG: hypothetical protein L6Q40_13685 [Azonexus sp.]|nr:hypothetical protein [Azonexus sp.]
MLQTYEAVLEPNGHLHFLEGLPATLSESCRVLVTFTQTAQVVQTPQEDWRHLAGTLKDSPNLNGDPLPLQQEMRHEWD